MIQLGWCVTLTLTPGSGESATFMALHRAAIHAMMRGMIPSMARRASSTGDAGLVSRRGLASYNIALIGYCTVTRGGLASYNIALIGYCTVTRGGLASYNTQHSHRTVQST
jgi:hypothetical protein